MLKVDMPPNPTVWPGIYGARVSFGKLLKTVGCQPEELNVTSF